MYLNLGNTSLQELEEFHYFRESFNFLYFCPRCCRNFETYTAVNNCKFCNSPARLLQQKKKKHAVKYKYLCEKCGKIESQKRIAECPTCKGSVAPMYKWDELNLGDRIFIWLSKMSKPSLKKPKTAEKNHPKSSFKVPLPRLSLKQINFSSRKSGEELPTN